MGLDSFFKIKKYSTPEWKKLNVKLCGGLFSGEGADYSFRGKVYNDLVQQVTGISLYSFEISNSDLIEMSNKLQETKYDIKWGAINKYPYDITKQEYADIKKIFKIAAETENCVLVGWW